MTRGINWDAQPLGEVSDDELAERLLVTRQAVCMQRRRRGIPPSPTRLTRLGLSKAERETMQTLEKGLDLIFNLDRPELAMVTMMAVKMTAGWDAESRYKRRGSGGVRLGHRVFMFRFLAAGRRKWTDWMDAPTARTWVLASGWPEAAENYAKSLRARGEGATA